MGQTLTHGVYLPDEGERNCYNGLAANWQLLDGAVGTIAEHTTALSGKAPLVHTHSKSDITDFPVYGTTAGTICEGNDSRLSDARTPIAHTHGKADITDLFNSANTWSAANTFTGNARPIRLRGSNNDIYNVRPQSAIYTQIDFVDKNDEIMSYILFQHRADATETHRLCLRQKRITLNTYYSVNLNNLGDFYPEQNNAINLGTASNKWNNLYAKNYFYNGVAWGLDKENVWSANQVLEGINVGRTLRLRKTTIAIGDPPPASGFTEIGTFVFSDKNNANFGLMNLRDYANGSTSLTLLCRQRYTDGARDTSGANKEAAIVLEVDSSTNPNFYPGANGTHNLGTSTNKWKTLNGINPGALSLPQRGSGATILDVTAQGLNWDLTGATDITYTPAFDGWLQLRCKDTDGDFLFATWGQIRQSVFGRGLLSVLNEGLALTIPVRKDIAVSMRCKVTANMVAAVTPCLGNV